MLEKAKLVVTVNHETVESLNVYMQILGRCLGV